VTRSPKCFSDSESPQLQDPATLASGISPQKKKREALESDAEFVVNPLQTLELAFHRNALKVFADG